MVSTHMYRYGGAHSYTDEGVHSYTDEGVHSYTDVGVHSYTDEGVHSFIAQRLDGQRACRPADRNIGAYQRHEQQHHVTERKHHREVEAETVLPVGGIGHEVIEHLHRVQAVKPCVEVQEGNDQHESDRQQQPRLNKELAHNASLRSAHTAHQSDIAPAGIATYPEGAHHAEENAEQGEGGEGVLQTEFVGDATPHGIGFAQRGEVLQAVAIEVAHGELRLHLLPEALPEGGHVHARLQTEDEGISPRHVRTALHIGLHPDEERIGLLVVAVLEVAEHARHLQRLIALVHFLPHGVHGAEEALRQPLGDESLILGLCGQAEVTARAGILHAVSTEQVAAIHRHEFIPLGMYIAFILVQGGGVGKDLRAAPRAAVGEGHVAGDGPAVHLGQFADDACHALVSYEVHRVGRHVGVIAAVRPFIRANVHHVQPFGVIATGDGTIGGQYINRVDDGPEEEAGNEQFEEYPGVLATLVPQLV